MFVTPGERYMVIIDFSAASQGSTFTMYNSPVPWTISEAPGFCYTHLVMRFVVEDDLPQNPRETSEPFNPQVRKHMRLRLHQLTDMTSGFCARELTVSCAVLAPCSSTVRGRPNSHHRCEL